MELISEYLFVRYIGRKDPLPFPEYLMPENRYVNDFWITQEGQCIYPREMDHGHLVNTIRLMHRSNSALASWYDEAHGDDHILYGLAPWSTKRGKKHKGNSAMTQYFSLWEKCRIYMLLRREVKLRGLEEWL